jgi:pectate lyase
MKRQIIFYSMFLLAAIPALSQININECTGWLESAYVKWQAVANAASYEVYYSGEGISDRKIDTQLIRSYGSYFRADVLGLKAGTYTLTVKAVDTNGAELAASTASSVAVLPHDRSGFAFTGGGEPGAYKADGTLKNNAQVIYLTAATAKTVSLDVVVDNKGKVETGVGIYEILKKREKGDDFTPLAIRVIGKITTGDMPSGVVSASYIDLKNTQNLTVEGIGDDATAFAWGVHVRGSSNIEVRNMAFMRFGDDGVSLEVDNSNIWVHNNDLFYGKQGSGDKAKGDGAIDVKTSALVTVSYNHFWDSGKCNLLGNGTEPEEKLSYHHNWYDHSDSRHPRVRCHTVHVYNNYYSNVAKYGIGSTKASSVFAEANYFEQTKHPMLISKQGSDIAGGSKGTFSSESGGIIKAYNNYMDAYSQSSFAPYSGSNTVEFDAYVATERNETLPATIKAKQGGATYNNFDTNASLMYPYTPDTPEQAKEKVMQYAGRVSGGDFKPSNLLGSQTDSDDPLSGLSSAIDSYTSSLVSIQGDGSGNGGGGDNGGNGGGDGGDDGGDDGGGDDSPVAPGDMAHNFTASDKNSSFFSMTGNLSKTYGSVSYAGLTLTQCLKMESSTDISFTTTQAGTLTLVFGGTTSASGKKVKVDGENYTLDASQILTKELSAGAHTVAKGDAINLFYMSVVYNNASGINNPANATLRLYPNPVLNTLNVISDDVVRKLEVYTSSGVLLQRREGNIRTLDVSGLQRGSYIAKIYTGKETLQQIIIKK